MTPKEEQEFLAWAIVTPTTHTEITCTCPDCGAVFNRWLQNHLVEDPINRQMEEQPIVHSVWMNSSQRTKILNLEVKNDLHCAIQRLDRATPQRHL